jgi:signal peptidase I
MGRLLILLLATVGGLIVVAVLAFALVAGTYRAPSESMAPTLGVGSRFTVLKFGDPEVGDIVVVNPPSGAESGGGEMCGSGTPAEGQMCAKPTARKADVKFVKRVVGVGGDRISMRGGRVVRNGKRETTKGPEACDGEGCEFPKEITVPKDHLFLLGDNRGASDDSRFWGPVPEKWLVGRLWFVYKN